MKRVILLLALMFSLFAAHAQVNIPRQELRYNAHYHWGMVDVMIGHGVVTMECRDNRFNATIDGNSIPWEGRVFCISDTLHTIMSPTSGLSKETVTYENGWYLKPKVTEYRSGNFVPSILRTIRISRVVERRCECQHDGGDSYNGGYARDVLLFS